jgi:hypothetical protein
MVQKTYSVVVSEGNVVNTDPVWINGTPPTISGITTAGGVYSLFPYAFDAEGDSFTFTRTGGTAPASITVDRDSGIITVPAGVAQGTYSLIVNLAPETSTVTPDSDFAERAGGAGVQWYHNFTSDAEVSKFWVHGAAGSDPDPSPHDYVRRGTSPFGSSGSLEYYCPSNWALHHSWIRPFNCLPGDLKYTNSVKQPDIPYYWGEYGRHDGWSGWQHGRYGLQYSDNDPVWHGREFYIQFRVFYDAAEEAYYYQLGGGDYSGGAKLTFISWIGGRGSNNQCIITAGPHRLYPSTNFSNGANSSLQRHQTGPGSSYGGGQWAAANAYRLRKEGLPITETEWNQNSYMPGGNYEASCYYAQGGITGNFCPHYQLGGWTTVLIRVRGGHNPVALVPYGDNPDMANPANDVARDTLIEYWLSTQNDIDNGLGYTETTRGKIYSKSDLLFFPGDQNGYNNVPLMWNAFIPFMYNNNANYTGGDRYRRFSQIIFSHDFIPCPRPGC